jgi:hypothetical protein
MLNDSHIFKSPTLNKMGLIAVSIVISVALLFGFIPAKPAQAASDKVNSITPVQDSIGYDSSARVPYVESGIRNQIHQGQNSIPLQGMSEYASALVRISAFKPNSDVQMSVAGVQALSVQAGHDGSTTVLTPIRDGKIGIESNQSVTSRVEVLAGFAAQPKMPGSTNALQQGTTLQSGSISGTDTQIGVLGLGDIPSTNVRALYITVNVELSQAGIVDLGGQALSLPQGRSVVSTIVLPNQHQGTVNISSPNAAGSFTMYARGWVTGSPANTSASNVSGSFVPSTNARWSKTDVAPGSNGKLAIPHSSDSDFDIVLASSEKTSTRSFVDIGSILRGRSRGMLVDEQTGAVPQMEIVKSNSNQVPVSVRGAAASVQALSLGSLVGSPVDKPSTSNISISSPATGSTVKLAQTGEVKLSGTVDSSASVKSIVVKANGKEIGTAAISYSPDHIDWSFEGAAPSTQTVEYTIVESSRDGSTAQADTTVHVVLPTSNDVVVASDVKVINPDDANNPVLSVSPHSVIFNAQPDCGINDVIVSGTGHGAPDGFIRRVVSVEHTGQSWTIHTKPAVLTDVFLQAKIDYAKPAINGGTSITENTNPDPAVQVIDEGQSDADVVDPASVDFNIPHEQNKAATGTVAYRARKASTDAHSVSSAIYGGNHASASRFISTDVESGLSAERAIKFSGAYELEGSKTINYSKAKHAAKKANDAAKADGKASVAFESTAKIGAKLHVDISVTWNWVVPVSELQEFKASAYGEVKATQTISAHGNIDAPYSQQLFTIDTPDITFSVGPVPVVVTTAVPVIFDADIKAEAQLQYTTTWKRSFEQGYEYTKSHGWNRIDTSDQDSKNDDPCWPAGVSASATLSASAGLTFKPEIKIYNVVGPVISTKAEVSGEYKISGDSEHYFKASGNIDLNVSLSADMSAEIPIVDWSATAHFGEVTKKINLLKYDSKQFSLTCPADSDDSGDTGDDKTVAISGTVTDASTGGPVENAEVTFSPTSADGSPTTVMTDNLGEYSATVAKGAYSVSTQAHGFVADSRNITIATDNQIINISLIRPASSTTEYKAVLTWGEYPRDLDSHLVGSNGTDAPYHIYYSVPEANSADDGHVIASLDHDDTTSYGPETVTFDVSPSGTYNYYVQNYSRDGDLNRSDAEVRLYEGNNLIRTFTIPASWSDNNQWSVFSIVNGNVRNPLNDDLQSNTERQLK